MNLTDLDLPVFRLGLGPGFFFALVMILTQGLASTLLTEPSSVPSYHFCIFRSRMTRAVVPNLWITTPLGLPISYSSYQIFALQFITVAKYEVAVK